MIIQRDKGLRGGLYDDPKGGGLRGGLHFDPGGAGGGGGE